MCSECIKSSLSRAYNLLVLRFRVNLYFKQVKAEIILMQFAGLSFSFFVWPGIQVRFNEHKPTISLSFLDLFTIDAHAVFKVKLTEIDWLTHTHNQTNKEEGEREEKAALLRLGGRLCHRHDPCPHFCGFHSCNDRSKWLNGNIWWPIWLNFGFIVFKFAK